MLTTESSRKAVARTRLVAGSSLRAGDVLAGRFVVESLARPPGTRDTSACLAAVDTKSRARVAIDLLVADGEGIDAVRRAFLAGARSATPLEGPHVARVLASGVTAEGLPWVAREEAPPRSLASVLAEAHSLSTAHAVDVALAVCDAVAEAHAHDVVHGALDANSVHLVWTADGPSAVKVVDLGTASALARLPLAASASRAPEQLEREAAIDERADVWGLGVLLYTALAGAPPFAAETPSGVNLAVALDEPASLAGVPDEIAELVEACLSKNPALRPTSLIHVAEALARFGSSSSSELLERIRLHDTAPTLLVKKESRPTPVALALPKRSSLAPVAITYVRRAPPSRGVAWKAACLAGAAACLVLAAHIAAKPSSSAAPARTAGGAIAAADAPGTATPAPEPALGDRAPAVTATMVATNANALPDAHPTAAKPVAAHRVAPPGRATNAANAPRATNVAAISPDSPVKQPEPKASDDDLRRFLDDRR